MEEYNLLLVSCGARKVTYHIVHILADPSLKDLCDNKGCKSDMGCTGTSLSLACNCHKGFTLNGDGVTCDDDDECTADNSLCEHGTCVNIDGSYNCTCNVGYTYDDLLKECHRKFVHSGVN